MTIYKCGTKVTTKIGAISAIITCSSIRFERIIYEISYFKDSIYYQVLLHEEEFLVVDETEKMKIGFKK